MKLSRLREHFGSAGLVVAIVALVAALGGGAYAATGGSGGGKATASAKQGKQGKQGKPGKTGPAGPAGPAGPTGPAGAQGPAGPKGDTGATGAAGAPGKDGKNGKDGETGFTETLPEGATETGFWNSVPGPELLGSPSALATISFNIPTPAALEPIFNDVGYSGTSGDDCPGSAADPQAAEGKLCVYTTGTIQGSALGVEPTFMSGVIGSGSTPQGTGMIWSEALKLGGGMPAEQVAFGVYAASP